MFVVAIIDMSQLKPLLMVAVESSSLSTFFLFFLQIASSSFNSSWLLVQRLVLSPYRRRCSVYLLY